MKKHAFLLIAVLSTLTGFARNPIVQTIYTADPAPLVVGDTLFLYTSHDEDKATWFVMKRWHIYSTTDMLNWTDRGMGLSLKDFKWANKDAWAGQCIERNGKYYWYVPMNQTGKVMAIGVAVSDSPTGPFKDALGAPLVCAGWGDIDPTVFIDTDGQAYLYWGNPHLYYVKLNEDMVSYDTKLGIVRVPLTEESFRYRIHNVHQTFAWAKSVDGTNAHCLQGKDKRYHWFVSVVDAATGRQGIATGVGGNALGPFKDVLGKALVLGAGEGELLNPTLITDAEKNPVLTWEQDGRSWFVRMDSTLTSYDATLGVQPVPAELTAMFRSKVKATANATEKRQTTYEEGPWLYRRNDLYYLFYPAGGVPEHLAWSTSKSLKDPHWVYGDTVMAVIGKGGAFTNHPGVVDFKGKTWLFYHNGSLPGGGGFNRSVCVDELKFHPDGRVQRVQPTAGLQEGVGNLNPYKWVPAATIAWEEGVETAADARMGVCVTDIDAGDYIRVRSVDFAKGARRFDATVASMQPGASLEVRLDSLNGTLLGSCPILDINNPEAWGTTSCRFKKVRGIHDLYFVFRGPAGDLFRFGSWKMSR